MHEHGFHHAFGSNGSRSARCRVRGFTLLESLMACGVLLVIVVAVTSAVTAGQQHAYEAHQRIAGTLAAEEWMGRLEALDYHALAPMHQIEDLGELMDAHGDPFPASFNGIGREAWVTLTYLEIPSPKIQLNGKTIRVRAFDAENRTLAEISRFKTEPPAETLSPEELDAYVGEGGGGSGGLLGGLVKRLFGR